MLGSSKSRAQPQFRGAFQGTWAWWLQRGKLALRVGRCSSCQNQGLEQLSRVCSLMPASPSQDPSQVRKSTCPQLISTPLSIIIIMIHLIIIIIITLKGSGSEELGEHITTQEK